MITFPLVFIVLTAMAVSGLAARSVPSTVVRTR
ncbi:hypothetical protein ABIC28_000507 [Rhodococcus sp. PvR044]|jgi:hypothetical protein|nr:hypothetical protein [Rhodococcus sp. PvR099]